VTNQRFLFFIQASRCLSVSLACHQRPKKWSIWEHFRGHRSFQDAVLGQKTFCECVWGAEDTDLVDNAAVCVRFICWLLVRVVELGHPLPWLCWPFSCWHKLNPLKEPFSMTGRMLYRSDKKRCETVVKGGALWMSYFTWSREECGSSNGCNCQCALWRQFEVGGTRGRNCVRRSGWFFRGAECVFVVFRETLSKRDKTFLLSMKVSGETCVCVFIRSCILSYYSHYFCTTKYAICF